MKKQNILTLALLSLIFSSVSAFANFEDRNVRFRDAQQRKTPTPLIIKWEGLIHSTDSDEINLEFIRRVDQKSFDIEPASELESLDWKDHKARVVSLTAELTPRFLFWGGNLVVKDYKIKEVRQYSPRTPDRSIARFHGVSERR